MQFIKYILSKFIRLFLYVFCIFPIQNNKIVFYPVNGRYYCNLKYISEMITKKYKNIRIIWITEEKNKNEYPKNIEICLKNSVLFFYHCMTSKIVIFNSGFKNYFLKRDCQKYIETWHGGGAYKKIDAVFENNKICFQRKRAKYILNNIDYVVSACEKFTEVFKKDTGINNAKFLKSGMPRNDIFFQTDKLINVSKKVYEFYGIEKEVKTILYAPTFRDDKEFLYDLDIKTLLDTLKTKFNKNFILLLRSHPHVKQNILKNYKTEENIIDVSDYPDMQELLCTADVLITDYSSSMWDYSFTDKPCFIYANDIAKYKIERDFHTPMNEWPFPIATNNKELAENILNFKQDEYVEKIKKHHFDLGSFEDGHASEKVAKLINDICNGEIK